MDEGTYIHKIPPVLESSLCRTAQVTNSMKGSMEKNLQCTEEGEFTELFLFLFLLSDKRVAGNVEDRLYLHEGFCVLAQGVIRKVIGALKKAYS